MTLSDIKKLFAPFSRRLGAEKALGSLLLALAAGSAAGVAVFVASLFLPVKIKYPVCIAAAAGVSIAVFAVVFVLSRPKEKEIAERIDGTGFGNRAEACLELLGDRSAMSELQRRDTVREIAGVSPSSIKIRIDKKRLIAAAAALALIILCGFLPNPNITRIEAAESEKQKEEEKIAELTEKLEKKIEEADLPPEAEKKAKEIVSDLREQLESAQTPSEKLAAVNEASEKLDELIKEAK
jgi:hypothetical protein